MRELTTEILGVIDALTREVLYRGYWDADGVVGAGMVGNAEYLRELVGLPVLDDKAAIKICEV